MKKKEIATSEQKTPIPEIPAISFREWTPESESPRTFERFKVIRPFFMKIKSAESISLKSGDIVELNIKSSLLSEMFACGKIDPISRPIPPEGIYRSVSSFQTVIDGELLQVHSGNTLKLSAEEARLLLARRQIKPFNEETYFCLK